MAQTGSAIQRELKQNRPFETSGQEAIVALLRTADLVRRLLTARLAPYDVTLQQFNVLRILRGGGDAGVPTLAVAERMIEETPGITRLLDRLETKGLIRRERCTRDRRQHLCWLTTAGAALLHRLDRPVLAADDEVMKGLSEAERRNLVKHLDRIRQPHL